MGGFNYVSRELSSNPDDPFGYYTMRKANLKVIGDYGMATSRSLRQSKEDYLGNNS